MDTRSASVQRSINSFEKQMNLAYWRNIILFWGFSIFIRTLPSEGCDANPQGTTALTGNKGTFPNALNPLPFNTTCQWNITAPQGKVVRIEMRSASFRRPCSEQYLKIFDGPSTTNTLISQYCDDSVAAGDYFISTGQSLWVELRAGTLAYTLEVFYETLDIEDCSINATLDAPQWPVEHNFSSPYWPYGYRINSTCGWNIKAPENHIVKLQIESELKGSHGKVQAYDVEDSKLSLIARSTSDPNILYSKLRVIHVLFESFHEMTNVYSAKGLFVSFTAVYPGKDCSRSNSEEQNMNIVLKNSSGIFKTPGFPRNYPHDLINKCVWKIIAPRGNVVRIAFSSIQLYQFDCVVVVDGINNVFPVEIARRCGLKVSLTVYTSGREAEIRGIKGITRNTGPGFHVNYTMVPAASSGACIMDQNSTMQLTGEGRTFYSPGYPANPGRGMCSWNITVSDGLFVKLVLTIKRCDRSYVEIFDGTNSTTKSIGKFCNIQEKVIYSSGNSLLVRFVSNSEQTSNIGVLASYIAIAAIPASYACSQNTKSEQPIVLNGTHNTFASYDFPLYYPDGAQCDWRIESPDTSIVKITFHSFDLQRSHHCQDDYVELRQGRFIWTSTLIGRFCGSSFPGVITSNHSTVFVKFVSDMLGRYQGFRATALAIPNPAMGACKVQSVDNVIRLTNETGRLFSPLFPRPYPKDMTCTWIITAPEGHFVRLRMKSFRLFIDCDDSYLEIRDGDSTSSTLLNQFCSRNYYLSVFSSGQNMWVRFRSFRSVSLDEAGFDAVFEAVKQVPASFSCIASNLKTTLTLESGSLASYNYPLHYDDPIECVWIIRVSTNKRIQLSFDFFNVSASGSSCDDDYVEVRNGQFGTSDLVGKYCGAKMPPKKTSDHWDLRVVFKSSGKARYPGFKASYETERTDKTVQILKIVGICLGVLSVVCTVIAVGCKYCKSSRGDQVSQETGEQGLDNAQVPFQEATTNF